MGVFPARKSAPSPSMASLTRAFSASIYPSSTPRRWWPTACSSMWICSGSAVWSCRRRRRNFWSAAGSSGRTASHVLRVGVGLFHGAEQIDDPLLLVVLRDQVLRVRVAGAGGQRQDRQSRQAGGDPSSHDSYIIRTANAVDGKLVAIPQEVVAYGLFVNVDLFRQCGLERPDSSPRCTSCIPRWRPGPPPPWPPSDPRRCAPRSPRWGRSFPWG